MAHFKQYRIAKELNVSSTTVSRALRNHTGVSLRVKNRVQNAAKALGYMPDFTLGVVIPSFENSFYTRVADSIIDTAAKKNYKIFITESQENQQSENFNIQSLINLNVDGLIVCVSQQTKDPQIFYHIEKLKIPVVFFDRQFEGLNFPSVTFDDKNGTEKALDKIIGQGYTKIAHFAGYSNVSIGKKRCLGYKYALQKKGIEVNPEWIIEGGFEIKDGYNSFMKLYNSKNLPEIIFTVNDRVALGVYQAMAEKGLKIPEDIGIAGFGYKETAYSFTPSLTIINQDPEKIGSAAAELLIEMIKNPGIKMHRNKIIEEEFFWNDSILKRNDHKNLC